MSDDRAITAIFVDWQRPDSPGCAVGVLSDGRIEAWGFGMADLEHDVPITPATVFHAASLSKQFTGVAVLLLEAADSLSLDDDVRRYLPEVPDFGWRITLRHLLHHTSGLRDHFPLLRLAGWRSMDEKTEDDIRWLVRRQRALNFRPGQTFCYCNTGYVLLAAVVSRVSGEPFDEFTRKRIFEPLGMAASRFRARHGDLMPGRAYGYTRGDNGQFAVWTPNFDFVGSTGLHTTVGDLLRWAGALIDAPPEWAHVVRRLITPGTVGAGRPVRYGGGVEIGTYRDLRIVKHNGWDLGYEAHLAMYPDERFAVAILGNIATPTLTAPEVLARRVADAALAGRFPKPGDTPIALPPRVAEKGGVYRHVRSNRALWLQAADGQLRLASEHRPNAGMALQALADGRFLGSDETTEVILADRSLIVRHQQGVDEVFRRAPQWKPSTAALAEYAGLYQSPELDVTLTVTADPSGLVVEERKAAPRPVLPAYRDAFTNDNTTYRFSRNCTGAIDAVLLSLERVHNLRFERVSPPTRRARRTSKRRR